MDDMKLLQSLEYQVHSVTLPCYFQTMASTLVQMAISASYSMSEFQLEP